MTTGAEGGLFDLRGRVALVTGAGGGFGAVIAHALAAQGAFVVLTGRKTERLEDVAEQIGGKVVTADLHDFDAYALVHAAEKCFGKPVSILINNAGVGHAGNAVMLPREVWRAVLEVDLSAPFYLAQEVSRRMIECELTGSILNIASVFGMRPTKGMVAYATAKAGLIQMTRCLALELNGRVRVNALCPGWHDTDMTHAYLESERGRAILRDIPAKAFGHPDDLIGAVLLLVSDAGSYINGATLTVDGGLSAGERNG